ncbi:thioesterase family protein [Hypoxylon trugodes]|uniref:thioesterase family protein n=1 Tax=Hypoxylon trugodes TaxID=326681 RepID=UPI00218E1DC9|nr:thioesterase family protein [Hypoxylon trugodes]KAI1394391.1 thioesterase family protein [Hypoxylon trugodes]
MASDEADKRIGTHVPFSKAIKTEKLDSHTYRVNLNEAFCIGSVPNGGCVGSCMLATASAYLSSRNQPDTLTAHFEYPGRTAVGPAIVVVDDVKPGRQLSIIHLTLWQGGLLAEAPWVDRAVSRRAVLAYATHTNLQTFTGMTWPTGWKVTAEATLPPTPDFKVLKTEGVDQTWEEYTLPKSSASLWRSLCNWRFYLPRKGPLTPGVLDMWLCTASGERITQKALPYVVDSFPFNMHRFLVAPELLALLEAPPAQGSDGDARAKEVREKDQQRASLWYPTVVMNIEAKAALPEEGVEWLNVRITSKQIMDGRFDLDILVRDTEGELVSLSHHVALVLSIERNTKRAPPAL